MNFFEKFSVAVIASITLLNTGTSQPFALPEQPVDRESSLRVDAVTENLSFIPPTFKYAPIDSNAPLVKSSTWQRVGQNAAVVGDYPNALAAFDKAVQLSTETDPELFEQRGWLHYSLGYEEEALEDFAEAAELHLDERNFSAHNNAVHMHKFVDVQLHS